MATTRSVSSRSGPHLEIPGQTTALGDAGAHSLSSDEEYFSDASEGRRKTSRPATPVSPVPKTRVERVDDEPAYGEIPGTPAYEKRSKDAVPDEVEILTPDRSSKLSSQAQEGLPPTSSTIVPRTIVEKINPEESDYGEEPGSSAYRHRKVDSVPDAIVKAPAPGTRRSFNLEEGTEDEENVTARPKSPIPDTIVTPVDPQPSSGLPGPAEDHSTAPLSKAQKAHPHAHDQDHEHDQDTMIDDFDDFEEGEQLPDGAHPDDDDFGDFDQPFDQPDGQQIHEPVPSQPILPLIDFAALSTVPDLLAATQQHLDYLFPATASEKTAATSPAEPINSASPVLSSDLSSSLWKQLVTPPPLQPPNWAQSRIRRLFLVSLGVPVDLDQVLPPSKQKKLILPDINLGQPSRKSESDKLLGSVSSLKQQTANGSTASIDSNQSGTREGRPRGRRNKGPPPPPDLDLSAVRRLCATTDEKLDGFTNAEIQAHVKELKLMTEKTSELLEYWLKRRDGLRKEKEAFDGVIENLVAHVRRVRR